MENFSLKQNETASGTAKEIYGFLPTSVWEVTEHFKWAHLKDRGDPLRIKKIHRGYWKGLMGKSVGSRDGVYLQPYSHFNASVAERCYKYWSQPGDLVLDPFAGRSTRAIVAVLLGRNYVGYEIAPLTYQLILKDLEKHIKERQLSFLDKDIGTHQIHLSDGTKLENTPDSSCDLVFTCPPYHRQEKYESTPGQLSDIKNYQEFLFKIRTAITNCYRVLKSGKFCVWVVADWRVDKTLVTFHLDRMRAMIETGFSPHDIIVNVNFTPMIGGAGQAAAHNYTVKVHEYILVGRKGN